jgi:cytidine deaminase
MDTGANGGPVGNGAARDGGGPVGNGAANRGGAGGIDWTTLREAARLAMSRAYAPYSRFPVGAAGLVDDGRIVVGCNVENACYGVGLCAECGMVGALAAGGGGRLVAVACVDAAGVPLMPCGRCRQLLWEHGGPDCLIDHVDSPVPMARLLPYPFDVADLDRQGVAPGAGQTPRSDPGEVPARLGEYVGQGTVFVHADALNGRQVWTGYWERASHADEAAGILEEAPTWPDVAAAIEWGRARTPRVVVVDPDGSASWEGTGPAPTGMSRKWKDHP